MTILTGRAQAQVAIKMGYSGAGVAQSLYNTIDRAGLWAKYNLDVKAIYFNSGALTVQALVGGDIDLTDSNIPTMLNLKAAGVLEVRMIAGWMNRITLSFLARTRLAPRVRIVNTRTRSLNRATACGAMRRLGVFSP